MEPCVSTNVLVSDVKTDEAVPGTSGVKQLKSKEGVNYVNHVLNDEEMEDVLSDDLELQEDSLCEDGNSQELYSVYLKLIFQDDLTKTHCIA